MPIMELFCCAALFFSAEAAGLLFLRAKRKTVFLLALLAGLLGAGLLKLLPNLWSVLCVCLVCAALSSLFFLFEKRPREDGFLSFCVCIGAGGLYAAWTRGLLSLCASAFSVCIFSVAFALVFPLAMRLFPKFSLPEDWQLKFEKQKTDVPGGGYEIRSQYLCILAAATAVLMMAFFPLVSIASAVSFAVQMVLALAFFWGVLWLMPLLVDYSSKNAMFSAEYGYRSEMNTFMNVVRSQRHDYNLHVQTVASLIRQQKWDECRQYVNALTVDTAATNTILPVKDPAIAALIDNYRTLAARRKIRLDVDIRDDLSHVVTNVYETNKIIGNLLQNAIDEVEQMEDRSAGIQLDIFKRGEFCMIRVSNRVAELNAFCQRQENVFTPGYSTKRGHDGIGLSSIQVLASRVGGEVSAWTEGNTVHFIASIPELYAGAVR